MSFSDKTPEESSPLCSWEDQRFVFLRMFVSRLNWINLSLMQFSSWAGNGLKTCTRCLQISTLRHRESIRCVGRSVSRSADSACSHADLPIHHLAAWLKQCEDMSRRVCTCTDKVVQGRPQHCNKRLHARPFSSSQRNMDKQLSFPRVSATISPHDLITVSHRP